MTYKTHHTGWFLPVGHGLFHAGKIVFGDDPASSFTYVVDCGAETTDDQRTELIRSANDFLGTGHPLDVLFITHLHNDHVNGVMELLRSRQVHQGDISVRHVVLPYLYPAERMALYSLVEEGGEPPSDSYRRFIRRPAYALVDKGAAEVVFLRGGGESTQAPRLDDLLSDEPAPDDFIGPRGWRDTEEEYIGPLRSEALKAEAMCDGDAYPRTPMQFITSRQFLTHSLWRFVLFNKDPERRRLATFLNKAKSICQGALMEEILMDKARLRQLARAYRKIFGTKSSPKMNETSLAVFSATPYRKGEEWRFSGTLLAERACQCWFASDMRRTAIGLRGFVFTGDLPVKDVWDDFGNRFGLRGRGRSSDCLVYQVPHHGSRANWGAEQARLPHGPVMAVCASRSMKHCRPPSKEVLTHIAKTGRLAWVHEDNEGLRYRFSSSANPPKGTLAVETGIRLASSSASNASSE